MVVAGVLPEKWSDISMTTEPIEIVSKAVKPVFASSNTGTSKHWFVNNSSLITTNVHCCYSFRLIYPSSPGDTSAALREAMKYPFRVGVAKLLVLLPCSACSGDMYALGQVLRSHGFLMHVLKTQDFKVTESANHSPVRLFGECLS